MAASHHGVTRFGQTGDDEPKVILEPFFGRIVMATRMRPEGDRIIGEGRSWHYDGNDVLVKDTGWQPTGCYLYWPKEEPKPWWKFW